MQVSEVPATTGLSKKWPNPIQPERFAGKHERQLGKGVGLTQFGVNHVSLEPGSMSSLRHWHAGEDEFVYVLRGSVTLEDENGRHSLEAGVFVGFPAGEENGHHLLNESNEPVELLIVGSRRPGEDTVHYPDDDLGPIRK
jgi:uncharacterized cupin superfamily protein